MLKIFMIATVIHAGSAELKSFKDYELVPDLLSVAPLSLVKVTFPNGIKVSEGNLLLLSEVSESPDVLWEADPDSFYTLIFCDPDAPSRSDPTRRSVLHWLVVNIPAGDVTFGETVADFLPSAPPRGTGPHRYVFLVYRQPGPLEFCDMPEYTNRENRLNFSPESFAETNNLGTAIAGNFYQAQNAENEG